MFSASKYEQKVTRAPASISIITADDIKKFGYRSLADVLRATRGFYVSNDRNYSYLGSRGFLRPGDYNTRYLFLIDGHRMNDNVYDAGWIGTDGVLDVDLIDRVEVIRGPSSSIYGNSAFLGVVNIVTKTGTQIDGAEASVGGGSFDTYTGRFSFGKRFANDVEWLVSGSYHDSGGRSALYYPEFDQRISSDPRARNDGVARNSDGEESHQFFTSATYRDFTLTALYSSRTKDVPTASFGSFFGTGQERTSDERVFVALKYGHRFGENTEVLGRMSYDWYPYTGSYPYDFGVDNDPADVVIDKDRASGDWIATEFQLKQRVFHRHTVVAGVEYQENLHQHLFNYYDTNPRITNSDDERNGRRIAVYGQIEAVLRSNLLLNVGVRYDYYSTFGGTLNPRVGLIYNPWTRTTFKLLCGQAFRAPNDYEIVASASTVQPTSNAGLQPETIRTYEAVLEQYMPAHLRFSASAYYDDIDNLISQTPLPDGGVSFVNLNSVRATGLEFEMEEKHPSGLVARVSYAVQRTEDSQTAVELSNSPRHLVKGNVIVPLYRQKFFAGMELQYQSTVGTLSGGRAGGFVLANLTLFGKELVNGLDVSASAYNLFDTRYGFPGAEDHLQDVIFQDGRSIRLKLTYRF